MTVDNTMPAPGPSVSGRRVRRRWVPFTAAASAAALLAVGIATVGGGTAGAAAAPNAQAAGNFLDATIGGKPIDQIARLAYARAQNPGSVTDQNPLDVTLLNAIHLPLTGALNLPKLLGIDLGAAHQTALAKGDGQSRGSAGAVLNSGGVSVGGDGGAAPANAAIDLCGSAVSGGRCGTGPADNLGEVEVQVGAVASIARTPTYGPALAGGWPSNCAQSDPTCYEIAALDLGLGSPVLGQLLGTVNTTLAGVSGNLTRALAPVLGALSPGQRPSSCTLTDPALKDNIDLAGGAVTVDVAQAKITVDVRALLRAAHLDLNDLPPNTDLVKWLVGHLSDVLTNGLGGVVGGLITTLDDAAQTCLTALAPLAQTLGKQLTELRNAVPGILDGLSGAVQGVAGAVAPLLDALSGVLDIGVNVQPQLSSGDFKTALDTDPKQGMAPPPVPYAHTVRAIELRLLGANGVTVALANSAAGPSNPVVTPSGPPPTGTVPATSVPTGVPAGMGSRGGTPVLPIALLAVGVALAAGGVVSYRMRGALNRH